MDWIQVIVILAANLGVVIPLFLHSDSKMEAHRKETADILKGIADEMKDFHARLCVIEDRRTKILEKV
jgi:hypothetical protein